jgi:hypothetical protein
MKLYCVKITRSAYVLAKNEDRASDYECEIEDCEDSDTEIYETHSNELGWDKDCFVYHSGENDITLSEALQIVNESTSC